MVTRATAGFVEFALASRRTEFPADARAMAVDAITDLLGCMVAGAGEPLAPMLAGIMFDAPEDAGVPLAVSGRFASPHDSALYNLSLIHI